MFFLDYHVVLNVNDGSSTTTIRMMIGDEFIFYWSSDYSQGEVGHVTLKTKAMMTSNNTFAPDVSGVCIERQRNLFSMFFLYHFQTSTGMCNPHLLSACVLPFKYLHFFPACAIKQLIGVQKNEPTSRTYNKWRTILKTIKTKGWMITMATAVLPSQIPSLTLQWVTIDECAAQLRTVSVSVQLIVASLSSTSCFCIHQLLSLHLKPCALGLFTLQTFAVVWQLTVGFSLWDWVTGHFTAVNGVLEAVCANKAKNFFLGVLCHQLSSQSCVHAGTNAATSFACESCFKTHHNSAFLPLQGDPKQLFAFAFFVLCIHNWIAFLAPF